MDIKSFISEYSSEFVRGLQSPCTSVFQDEVELSIWYEKVILELEKIRANRRQLFMLGNGASASMSAHFSTDFTKNANIPTFCFGESSLLTCFSNDYSYEAAYQKMLEFYMKDGDGLILTSSSGESENLINAANFCRTNFPENPIVTLTAFNKGNSLNMLGKYNLYVGFDDYGKAESAHAYFLHLLLDVLIQDIEGN